ncbi:MAG: hypothetical protein KGM47_00045, partial [Acidobacteriota bacterium]|nr:hypothetical protein [Acidobacteriota bacterium]
GATSETPPLQIGSDTAPGASPATPLAAEQSEDTAVTSTTERAKSSEEVPSAAQTEQVRDAYALVIKQILALLNEPRDTEWLAETMCVRPAQMKDWLGRGVSEGRITKLKKPVRYAAHSRTLFTE